MKDLTSGLDELRIKYRECFLKAALEIKARIEALKPEDVDGELLDNFGVNTSGYKWQDSVLQMFESDYARDIFDTIEKIKHDRRQSHCIGCGTCCKLACSEFSPDELTKKAKDGDNYASQFIQTFVPYESLETPRKIFPEYVKLLEDKQESGYYFYHCPKVTEDNRCPDYDNRPQICRDFPDNPLGFLPFSCGFNDWKLKTEEDALFVNATVEIIEFYKNKIKEMRK
jgi:hypothetical protein